MPKISVIIPAYNERMKIVETIKIVDTTVKLLFGDQYEIIVVDDGSNDITRELIKTTQNNKVKTIPIDLNHGKGLALRAGVLLSDVNSQYVVFIDGDLQIHPKEIAPFFNLMGMYQADAIIGNKRHSFSQIEYTFRRRIISNIYNWLVRQMFGFDFRDTQCGLKLFTRQALIQATEQCRSMGFGFDLELLVSLRQLGFRIVDAPVAINKQVNKGSVSVDNIIHTWLETYRIWRRKKKGYYDKYNHTLPDNTRSPGLPR